LSTERDTSIAAIVKATAEAREESWAIEREVREHERHTRRAGNAYRQELTDQVFAKAGIDPSILERRHAFSESNDKRFFDAMKLRIDANSERVAAQQQIRINAFRKRFPKPSSPNSATHAGTIIATADKMGAVPTSVKV